MSSTIRSVLFLLALSGAARAQWSADPALNLPVSLAPSDQVQPKLAPAPDGGGVWLSWFDGIGTGYDVRLQRLGENGTELLSPGGVLVADRNFSSTQDYGLDVSADSALLTFRDDRFGGVQITAARMGVDGTALWGANGVQLTNTTESVAAPSIARFTGGGAVVAWTQGSTVRVQRLSAGGVPQWAQDVVLTPSVGSYSVCDLHTDANAANPIVSFVHQTGGFGSPRRLLAQKFGADGTLLWGAAHVQVFDTGSLQFGNFPDFTTDAAGGAVFSWYDASSSQLQCYVQRILADGSEGFVHNGVPVSIDLTRVRVEPTAWLDSLTGRTTVAWREQNSAQSQNGVWVQQLDAAGNRLWSDSGRVVLPLSVNEVTQVRQAHTLAGTLVFWNISPSFGQGQLFGARLDDNGFIDLGPFPVATTPSSKSRLAAADSATGFAILAWSDDRNDAGDLLVQNVHSDSTLGRTGSESCFGVGCPCANDEASAGCGNSTGDGAYLAGVGSLSVAVDDFALATTQAPVGSNCLLFMGNPALSGLPVPFGDGLRCIGGSTWRWSLSNTGISGTSLYGPGMAATSFANHPPAFQLQPGTSWIFQLWYRDPSGPCGSGFNVSNAVTATFLP